MHKLTAREKRTLKFIENYLDANAEAPDLYTIKEHLGIKTMTSIHRHIRALEQKGYLQRDNAANIGIRYVLNAGKYIGEFIKIPMVGTIVAGYPLQAVSEISEFLSLPNDGFARNKNYFALKVAGNSMKDVFVLEGDIVIVEQTSIVNEGDMVVAILAGGDATLKKFFWHSEQIICLKPENPEFKPIFAHVSQVEIQGKVVRVIRNSHAI